MRQLVLSAWFGSALFISSAGVMSAPLPGAIFTTNEGCTQVNGNIYESAGDVYLNGGPTKPGAAGLLPEATYYVRVTDPSGAQVLGSSGSTRPVVTDASGNVTGCLQLASIVRKGDGSLGFASTSNPGGVYKVWVSTSSTFSNNSTKTDVFKVKGEATEPPGPGQIHVRKFYDKNANGKWDFGEPEIKSLTAGDGMGWKVDIIGMDQKFTKTTYGGLQVNGTNYIVREYQPVQSNWLSTTPVPISATPQFLNQAPVKLTATYPTKTICFGNVCTGPGGGLTKGFWGNKNGEATMAAGPGTMSGQLESLRNRHLVTAAGAPFDPYQYADFKAWLQAGNAANMAYMLSAQLAAMHLNVLNGKVSGMAMIHAPGTSSANAAGFASVNAIMAEANVQLGTHSMTLAGHPQRRIQELLKNALDNANNNKNFVQPKACPFRFEN